MTTYQLHIPRTSGGHIRNMVRQNTRFNSLVVGHYRTISEDAFSKAGYIGGHYGTAPCKFSNKTFTVIRDPNELTFSYIKYLSLVSGNFELSEDHLKRYLYEEALRKSVTNVISRFITLPVEIKKYNSHIGNSLQMANNSWYLEDRYVSAEDAMISIKKNSIKLFLYTSPSIYEDIFKFLDVDPIKKPTIRVNSSGAPRLELFEKYLAEIQEANVVDNDLYERLVT